MSDKRWLSGLRSTGKLATVTFLGALAARLRARRTQATRIGRHLLMGGLVTAWPILSMPAASAQEQPAALSGVWSTTVTAVEHPGWSIEELFQCMCTSDTYERIAEFLNDPVNDNLSAAEIMRAIRTQNSRSIAELFTETARQYAADFDHADDPAIQCEPFGAFRSLLHADPIQFEQHADRLIVRGEDMASDRTIFIDGRGHPADVQPSPMGHSIGRYEGSTLVVETVGVSANIAEDSLNIHNSDEATSIERYTLSEDGSRLHMTFTLDDPVMFREPLTLQRTRLLTPEVQLQDLPCEAISGQP